tara:strand:+ start:2990 stop:3103 length:114 start_codon:yes stop_codon:yes gene_type:complete
MDIVITVVFVIIIAVLIIKRVKPEVYTTAKEYIKGWF